MALVEELEGIYDDDLTIKNLTNSRTFKTTNNVEETIELVSDNTVKENLLGRILKLNRTLNDTTSPVVTGVPTNGITNKDVTLEVNDTTNVTKKVLLNGLETQEFANTNTYNLEGKYVITYIDEAFNETKVEFTIDKTAPEVLSVTKSNNDKSTNKDVTVTIKFNEEVNAPDGWTKISGTEYSKVYSENGKNTVRFTDMAGNTVDVFFEVKRIDKIAPDATVKTSNNGLPTNKDVTVTITANEAIYKPTGWTEVVTNKEHEFTKVYTENGDYSVEITDKAGNKSTINFKVEGIDKTAPVMTSLRMTGTKYYNENGNIVWYVKNNETIYVYVTFAEKLYTNPTITLNNSKTVTAYLAKSDNNSYIYAGAFKLTDGDGLLDGNVTFTVKDYSDEAGNIGVTLTNEDITLSSQKYVVIDRTNVKISVSGGTIGSNPYSKLNLKFYDANGVAKVVINGKTLSHTGKYVDINDGHAYTFIEGKNIVEVTDKAGNVTTETFIKDTIAPVITAHSLVGKDPYYSQISFKLYDNNAVDYFVLNGTKYDRTNAMWSDANYQNIKNSLVDGENTIVLYDVAGNSSEYKFELDLVKPTITIKDTSESKNNIYTNISFKLSDDHLIDKFVVNDKTFDVTDNMWGDANFGAIKGALKEGTNTITLYDVAGNSSDLEFEYTEYTLVKTVEELEEAIKTSGKIKLLNDITIEKRLGIPADANITLDMNGKKISGKENAELNLLLLVYGKLTITGNGILDATNTKGERVAQVSKEGRIYIEDGYFIGQLIQFNNAWIHIFGGTFRGVNYYPDSYYYSSVAVINEPWAEGDIRVWGGTFIGMNPAWGDEGRCKGGPLYESGFTQGWFFEGQTRTSDIPEGFTITESKTDGIPTYTVTYTGNMNIN